MNVLNTLANVGQKARVHVRGLRRALLRLPRRGLVVRAAPSMIAGTGVFVLRAMRVGEAIGALELGPPIRQDRHSLLVGAHHRDVMKPWRFLNHACTPTATLQFTDQNALLFAARDLPAYAELTIDYNALPEDVGTAFECRCGHCSGAGAPSQIGRVGVADPPEAHARSEPLESR